MKTKEFQAYGSAGLADALRNIAAHDYITGCGPQLDHLFQTWIDGAREALAAYNARKPEPPSLADALRASVAALDLFADSNNDCAEAHTKAREALAAYDARQPTGGTGQAE